MPYVTDGRAAKEWVTKNGSSFGLMNGMGSAGRKYEPARSTAPTGWPRPGSMADGEKGIRRLTDPDLRLKETGSRWRPGRGVVRHPRRHQPPQ